MYKVQLKDHYRDQPGAREHICPEKGTISGISFESDEERNDAMQILAQKGYVSSWTIRS